MLQFNFDKHWFNWVLYEVIRVVDKEKTQDHENSAMNSCQKRVSLGMTVFRANKQWHTYLTYYEFLDASK